MKTEWVIKYRAKFSTVLKKISDLVSVLQKANLHVTYASDSNPLL